MSLYLHRSERADLLAAGLAGLLSDPPRDPFAAEIVAVPTRGVERWLAQTLSSTLGAAVGRSDGVCALVDFPSPQRLIGNALAAVTGVDRREDPWRADRLTWVVLDRIEAARGERWARLLWTFVDGSASLSPGTVISADVPTSEPSAASGRTYRPGRRWSTAAHLADLFDRYAVQRPGMIRDWAAGRDVDPNGHPLDPTLAWQAELWRRVRSEIAEPSPAERLPDACRRLVERPEATDLPERLSVFGPTRIEPDQLRVLEALSRHRDVHLWLNHPSPVLWTRLAERLGDSAPERARVAGPRRDDPTTTLPRHRLLAYLGRDVRELQLQLATVDADSVVDLPTRDRPRPTDPGPTDPGAESGSLLTWLQRDITADRAAPPPAERPVLASGDSSVQLHVSHGPDRQVEVLREVLLGLLADDPTLEPRDIVVLCPDIETFAPLIAATFGLDTGAETAPGAPSRPPDHPGHRLRVRLADRALRRVNPLLSVLDQLLDLADSRLPASSLLDLAASPPVARRFGFSPDDLERMAQLIHSAGVRWGLDAAHRGRFGLGHLGQNTWAAGLDRMLLGVAMDREGEYFIGTALPLDEVDSSDVDLVGRVAELLARVRIFADRVLGVPAGGSTLRRPLGWWMETCRDALDSLTAVAPRDLWQSAHAYGELTRLAGQVGDEAGSADTEPDPGAGLSLADVRTLLADAFKGRATRANFRTGTLTMCTMLPMRSVPHRVICLLGVDEATFPRHRVADGDDILAADPWIGDRDPRSEDRQLLLDAVMAAEEHLVIVYSGIDARTGAGKPVAVPVGELLDALDETATVPGGRTVRWAITTRHTLQAFDPANFAPANFSPADVTPSGTPQSFDRAALRGAQAASGSRADPPDIFATATLERLPPPDEIALDELTRFFQHPARALLRLRARLYLGEDDPEPAEQLPIEPDGLQRWAIGDRMLQRHLDGVPIPQLEGAEWRRGELPPRRLGAATVRGLSADVTELAAAVAPYLGADRETRDVLVELDDRTLTGSVAGVRGERIVTALYSRLAAKHRLQAWIQLLALTATDPGVGWQAVTVGRGGRSVIGPVGERYARAVLADLVELFRTGRNEPLPFAPKTSAEYARIRGDGKSVAAMLGAIEREWCGTRGGRGRLPRPGERDDDYARFFPESVEELLAPRSGPDDVRGALGEPSRFGSLARRVWQPLLDHEELSR